jgi:hypothetical protein
VAFSDTNSKVPVTVAETMIKTIRMLAASGRRSFRTYLYDPLFYAGWKRDYSAETSARMMNRIEKLDGAQIRTIAAHCKRMIAQALTENLSALGNGSIFFLEMMMRHHAVATAPEALEFVSILEDPFRKFEVEQEGAMNSRFAEKLSASSTEALSEALAPVELGRRENTVKLKEEARILFEKIKRANQKGDLATCRKLISAYLIRFAEAEDNNRDEIEALIEAFEKRESGFRNELHSFMAINLYYQISKGISNGDLRTTIRSIRKYAFIFQGNPLVPYHREIDRLERKLYDIIREKNLMKELIRNS